MDFLNLAKERFSCRKFSSKPVEKEKIDKIIEAAMAAPTACNMQPFKIWEVNTPDSVAKLSKATPFTFGASEFLVVGADKNHTFVRKFDDKNFAQIDASIVSTHIMLAIHELGLGTTWVGYFDPAVLNTEFPQMSDYEVVAIFPIGYPAEDVTVSEMHGKSKSKQELVSVI